MQEKDASFSFYKLFFPLTTLKIIHFIFICGFLVYFNSLFNGFVGDDFDQIVHNQFVQQISNFPYFFLGGTFNNGFTPLSGMYYKPVMTIIFSLIYSLIGSGPFFYHLIQLILHIINSIFCFYVFNRFFSKNISFLGALLFLVHPINSEAVLYISNLQDILFTFFGLFGLLLLFYKNEKKQYKLFVSLFLLLSLLSKETGILFVLSTILYSILYLPIKKQKSISQSKINRIAFFISIIKRNFIYTLPVLFYILLRLNAVGLYSYHNELFPFTNLQLTQRLINIPAIILYYLKTYIFPIHLAFDQNWVIRSISLEGFIIPLLIILLVIFLIILLAKHIIIRQKERNTFYFFSVWVLSGLVLHLQIIPLDMTVADRWFYFPGIGLLGILCLTLNTTNIHFSKRNYFSKTAITIFLLALSLLTYFRTFDWRNQYTLYKHDIQYNKDSYSLLNGYGLELMNIGKYDEAKPYIQRSIEIEPDFCYSWNNLGSIAVHNKDYKSASKYYTEAVSRAGCVMAYENLATLLYYHFSLDESLLFTQKATKEVSNNARLYLLLSLEFHKKGNKEEAVTAIRKSLNIKQTPEAIFVYTKLMQNKEFELKEQ